MIPEMTTTNEAIKFGKIATQEQIEELKLQQQYYQKVCEKRSDNASMEELDAYLAIAFRGQFVREALESANGLII